MACTLCNIDVAVLSCNHYTPPIEHCVIIRLSSVHCGGVPRQSKRPLGAMSGGLFVGFSYEHGYYKGGLQPVLACPAATACPYEGGSDSLGVQFLPESSGHFLPVFLGSVFATFGSGFTQISLGSTTICCVLFCM